MTFNFKTCKTCAFKGKFQDDSWGCAKFKMKIDIDNDGCSWHKSESSCCSLCNTPSDSLNLFYYEETKEWYAFCPSCYQHIGACATCKDGEVCPFRSDKSEPSYITKVISQGFMRVQQQVKNPNLIEKHCSTCRCCWGTENCHKDEQGINCPNWQLRKELLP